MADLYYGRKIKIDSSLKDTIVNEFAGQSVRYHYDSHERGLADSCKVSRANPVLLQVGGRGFIYDSIRLHNHRLSELYGIDSIPEIIHFSPDDTIIIRD